MGRFVVEAAQRLNRRVGFTLVQKAFTDVLGYAKNDVFSTGPPKDGTLKSSIFSIFSFFSSGYTYPHVHHGVFLRVFPGSDCWPWCNFSGPVRVPRSLFLRRKHRGGDSRLYCISIQDTRAAPCLLVVYIRGCSSLTRLTWGGEVIQRGDCRPADYWI